MKRRTSVIAGVAVMVMGGVMVLVSLQGRDTYYLVVGLAAMAFGGRAIERLGQD